MVEYGLGILPLVRELRQAHPGATQPWYADDTGEDGTFEGIWRHLDDLMVIGPPAILLPGSGQEHLGHVYPERPAGGGLIPGLRTPDRDGKLLPWGICGDQGGAGPLAGGEDGWLEVFSGHIGRGEASEPVDRMRGPAEVPPSGGGLHAMRHPGHWGGLPGIEGCAAGNLPPGPLSGGHGTDPQEGYDRSANQTGRDLPP